MEPSRSKLRTIVTVYLKGGGVEGPFEYKVNGSFIDSSLPSQWYRPFDEKIKNHKGKFTHLQIVTWISELPRFTLPESILELMHWLDNNESLSKKDSIRLFLEFIEEHMEVRNAEYVIIERALIK